MYIYINMFLFTYLYICTHAYTYTLICKCLVCVYMCRFLCIYVSLSVYICVPLCVYVCPSLSIHVFLSLLPTDESAATKSHTSRRRERHSSGCRCDTQRQLLGRHIYACKDIRVKICAYEKILCANSIISANYSVDIYIWREFVWKEMRIWKIDHMYKKI